MRSLLSRLASRLASWAGSLSAPALAVIGVVIAGSVGGGGYYAYRTYNYVQHDNDFCLSCHLMADPYDRFARSAHRGLGCKACHQPTLVVRSRMALTQIIESPDSLEVHAEVTNDKCAECHIKGDPEKWELVKNSAGHRVHFESKDSSLQGMQCVRCHSTSLHEFAATDKTCAQAGCHEDNKIRLGKMKNLTIHCAACHGFLTPVPDSGGTQAVMAALAPDQNECLSCHEMRLLVDMPKPDPHEGSCASCHNPHTQDTPHDAVQSCTNVGCHTDVDTLSPMHRGLEPGALADCTKCHKAHDFKLSTTDCLACHRGILDDSTGVSPPPSAPGASSGPQEVQQTAALQTAALQRTAQQQPLRFSHSTHRNVACVSCHDSSKSHGALKVTSSADCRTCHHTGGLGTQCSRCHQEPGGGARPATTVERTFHLSVGKPTDRTMPFDHRKHTTESCATCHTQGVELSATEVDCTRCHEQHHALDTDCASCHRSPPATAHPVARAHGTCSGSGCHVNPPFEALPTSTREVCLVCHQQQKDHRPGRVCAECHALSGPGR